VRRGRKATGLIEIAELPGRRQFGFFVPYTSLSLMAGGLMKKQWLFVIVMLSIGCARPYAQYYHDNIRGMDTSFLIFTTEEPKLFNGTDPKEDSLKMVEEGYALLGYSSFTGQKFNENQAIDKAKELKASVVVVYSKFFDTKSGIRPVVIPDIKTSTSSGKATAYGSAFGSGGYASGSATAYGTGTTTTYGTQTIYQPYSIDRFEQGATYWAKTKGSISGIVPIDLPPELRQKIGSNKGVLIVAVIKQSPAFSADILRGDIIKKINNVEIIDLKVFMVTMFQSANKKVTITLLRDGKEIVKEVKLNPAPEGVEANLKKILAK
jgi:hypothetical protein